MILAFALASRAQALPAYMTTAQTTYAFKAGGTIERKSCGLCHSGSDPSANNLNLYGKDLQTAIKASADHQVTPALLHSLDEKDSDGDGWPNVREFASDTLPGDPASKPAGSPSVSVKQAASAAPAAESNPFDLKALLFPGHAQHPVFVHFPIALFVFSLFLDLFGILKKNSALNSAAYYNLVAAAVTGVLSLATGLVAWRVAFGGVSLSDDRMLLYHLVLGVVTTVLMCLLWVVRARQPKDDTRPLSNLYVVLGIITFVLISLTGHFGGIVSGVEK